MGDYNLVGSGKAVKVLAKPDGANLQQWILRHLGGQLVHTWRSLAPRSFPPGRLDAVMYSADVLIPKNGFVFDTGSLTNSEIRALGVIPTDSEVSDHLMLVADFEITKYLR